MFCFVELVAKLVVYPAALTVVWTNFAPTGEGKYLPLLTLFRAGYERLEIGRGGGFSAPCQISKAANRSGKRQTAFDSSLKDVQFLYKTF